MTRVIELAEPPRLARLYAAAIRPARSSRSPVLPDVELVLPEVVVDRDHLAAYDRMCGFRLSDTLPPTYPHVLAFPLHLQLMTDDAFPFAAAGMVHIRNLITTFGPLDAGVPLTIRVRAERLAAHPKGAQLDLVAEVSIGGAPAWTSRGTYLSRGAAAPDLPSLPDEPSPPADLSGQQSATWRVGKDVGRRYARVSGDVNPIHLHPLGARLFGFRGAIAHGMWTKARSLAALESRLPDALTADVSFQKPLPLGTTVRFRTQASPAGWDFVVVPTKDDRPHLTGSVRPA
ncbi:MAG: MaoC/PaaZ C-terminal domain-containing protein [Sporichthyaceae bacterium]